MCASTGPSSQRRSTISSGTKSADGFPARVDEVGPSPDQHARGRTYEVTTLAEVSSFPALRTV